MFIHVPAAWLAMVGWALMSVAALGTLVWRHPLADVAAKAAAPIGAAFTLLCLVTGSLWGRPMWGTYWVWDARLTSVLVLFLMYLGVIALWRTIDDPVARRRAPPRCSRLSARSTCRSSNSRSIGGTRCISRPRCCASAARPSTAILSPLLVMALAFTLLFLTLHLAAMRNEILRRRVRTHVLMQARRRAGIEHEPRTACRFHRRRLCCRGRRSWPALIAWVCSTMARSCACSPTWRRAA